MDKWMSICLIFFVFGMFSPVIVTEYGKKECRIEAIKAHMPADDIIKLCGK
jgi:hypothetical protein